MKDDRTKQYHLIAKACLKALNNATQHNSDPREKIQDVYDAIDEVFTTMFTKHEQALKSAHRALQQISDLDQAEHSLKKAVKIASLALDTTYTK